MLIFLITQGDDIFVGKLLGVTALGFYQLAYRISNMPATEITQVISQVTFPAYSKLQDDIPKLKEAYLKVLQLTAFLSFPIAGLIFVLAPDFTKIFLGEKWIPMVPAMMVLVWWGVIRAIGGINGSLLQAVGEPDILTKLNVIKLVIIIILIYPFSIKWGIVGTSLAVLLSAIFITPNTFFIVISRVLRIKIRVVLKTVSISFAGTAFMVLLLALFTPDNLSLAEFILAALTGVTCYLLVTYLLDSILKHKIWHNLKNVTSGVLK
jgi:O-antigen/teichoic acid export membrane protein